MPPFYDICGFLSVAVTEHNAWTIDFYIDVIIRFGDCEG